MSLNGLDAPEVHDAYHSAIAEAGGWFLLKYTARDSVELLGRGRGGVSEARNAILGCTEASPLYGLIIYRRRRILIKCIPDGTSRLLQARTAVHFHDVLERYSPYETLLEITNGEGLNDTALAASFQLRTASASPSPSPATNKLDEISEDAEDNGDAAESRSPAETPSHNLAAPPTLKMASRADHMRKFGKRASSRGVGNPRQLHGQPRSSSPSSPLKQSVSQYLVHEESGRPSITPLESPQPETLSAVSKSTTAVKEDSAQHSEDQRDTPDPASQLTATDASDATERPVPPRSSYKQTTPAAELRDRELPAPPTNAIVSTAERSASMSERAASTSSLAEEPYDFSKFDELFKPKVKLAPRPVHSPEKIQSPAVARVSALPASFRPANRKQEVPRPKSSGNGLDVPARPSPPAPTAPTAHTPPPPPPALGTLEYSARPNSRGSVRSAPSHKSHGMTPDKIRLMKAVELRRRQLRKSQAPLSQPIFDDDAPEVPKVPEVSDRAPSSPIRIIGTPDPAPEQELTTDDEEQPQSSKADSGIEIHYRKQDEASDDHSLQSTPSASKSSTPEPGTIPTSQLTGTLVAPPVFQESPKEEIDSAIQEAASQSLPDDDALSIASKTPTERSEFLVQENVPTELASVPTIIMADGSRPLTAGGQSLDPTADVNDDSQNVEDSGTKSLEQPPSSPRRQNSDMVKRRRGFVEPLHIDTNSGNPDDFMSDDDELLDELHSAVIVEATPVTVARSPLSPTSSGRRPSADTLASVRSVNITKMGSFPTDRGSDERLTPDSSRNAIQRTMTPPGGKTDSTSGLSRNVSSEISKRIQALSLQSRSLTPEGLPDGFAQRPTRARPTSYRRQSSNRATQSPARSRLFDTAPVWSVQHDPATNRNSVSVTARIVRPNVISESVAEDSSEALQQSEYLVNQEQDVAKSASRPDPIHIAKAQSETSPPALSPVLSRSSTEARTMHSSGNSRFGRHKHQNSSTPGSTLGLDEFPPPPGARTSGSTPSLISNDENAAPKEGTKASRFMKRMSILPFGGNNKRKSGARQYNSTASANGHETNGASASAAGAPADQSRVSSAYEKSDTPPAVVVGDLNVQFPDSLLWKRRIVTIDDSGYLQFAIAQAMEIHKGVALKKFALTDFKLPHVPDLDMQELPYSVMLEFHDGTTLQTACEDAMTQRQVLHILKTYWKSWA